MESLYALLAEYGLAIAFINVLAAKLGAPLPAVPTLVLTGALAAREQLSAPLLLASATAAAMLADTLWYLAGRRFGIRVLRLLCSVSLAPDSCVRQTETVYVRYGALSLVASKFVPGLSTVAAPLAGAWRLSFARFTLYNAIGALAWAGIGIGAGMIFNDQIERLMEWLSSFGAITVAAVLALLAAFIGWKWWQRRRFYRQLRMSRIDVPALRLLFDSGIAPQVLDVRGAQAREMDPRRIPGAIEVDPAAPEMALAELSREREIVVYCN
ncbi:MAG: VTT domain-containing protein [Proteobacteria bacterium]|nr:VTT domain-containing protein [Burkholderiales bacterium]